MKSPYQILGVKRDATADQIKAAYRRKAKCLHPDHGGDPAKFREVAAAYKLLLDPKARHAYDVRPRQNAGPATPPPRPVSPSQVARGAGQVERVARAAAVVIVLDALGDLIPAGHTRATARRIQAESESVLDKFFKSILKENRHA